MSAPRKRSSSGTWEQFTALTTIGQPFQFEVPTPDCCTNGKPRTYLAEPMAEYTINQREDLSGKLNKHSIKRIGQRVDELEQIKRDAKRMIADGTRGFGDKLPW